MPHICPILADAGYRGSRPAKSISATNLGGLDYLQREQLRVGIRGFPHLPKSGRYPYFLYAVPKSATCAAFIKESRMEFLEANQLRRKYGVWGTQAIF